MTSEPKPAAWPKRTRATGGTTNAYPSTFLALPGPSSDTSPMPLVSITIDTEFPDRAAADRTGVCDELLDILAARRVSATFFVVGSWARAYPDRIAAISEAGHHVGNHGDSHRKLTNMTDSEIVADLADCRDTLLRAGLETRPWFRAPYGEIGKLGGRINQAVAGAGYRHVRWHADGGDWKPRRRVQTVVETSLSGVRRRWPDPAIVLFHSWPDRTPNALAQVVDALESWAAEFVTISELMELHQTQAMNTRPLLSKEQWARRVVRKASHIGRRRSRASESYSPS
jgi:peptidoglycan/xylan/chitin deacetylase (PgdA/CDA1 family)